MKSEPRAPGAAAIYLYRQIDRDDTTQKQFSYTRIKVLTEEGRKYADIEIPFIKDLQKVQRIEARTIHPDGKIFDFDGKVYEKTIVKAKGLKYLAKTFTMPDVQVGSIVEYRFHEDREGFGSGWILSEELFTKHAKFSLKPYAGFALRWSWPAGLPKGTEPPKDIDHVIRLESNDIPAFQVEDYMPPVDEMKFHVDFIYMYDRIMEKDPDKFWKDEGKSFYEALEPFVKHNKAMEKAVEEIVSPSDTAELKLRKIYARVQQVRNFTYEREKSTQEYKREKLKEIKNVEDVWKRGYGDARVINWLFVALARAAGFQADSVFVARRNQTFFNAKLMNPRQLNDDVVVVKLDGKDVFLDPGTQFAPYGLLPWSETGVSGLRPEKEGGTWLTTPVPLPAETSIERKAALKLTDDGTLEGKTTVTYKGIEAMWRRIEERNEDDATRKNFLETQLQEYIPINSEVELTNKPEWNTSSQILVAEFDVKVPGWATSAGRRTLLAEGIFGGGEKHVFEHTTRTFPLYFSYPYRHVDDITIELPSGWQIANLPKEEKSDQKVCTYSIAAENKNGSLHVKRELVLDLMLLDAKYYDSVRSFFQTVRTGDEQQIILSAATAAAQN